MVSSLRALKKSRLIRYTARETGIRRNYLHKYTTKKTEDFEREARNDKTNKATIKRIHDFYNKPEESTILPNMKTASQEVPGNVLNRPVRELYKDYKHMYPEEKIRHSVFASLRPQNILPVQKRRLIQCLCEYCVNIDEALKCINRACMSNELDELRVSDRNHLSSMTLCPKQNEDLALTGNAHTVVLS